MKISELNVGQGNVEVQGVVGEVGEIRTFNKFGRELKVANAVLRDDSGSIRLSLWNEDADRFKEGDEVKIINGYVNEFQGEKQLTSGKFGSMEKVGEGSSGQTELSGESEPEGSSSEPVGEEPMQEEPAENMGEETKESSDF